MKKSTYTVNVTPSELAILWFLTTHNLKIIGCAIPFVLVGISIVQHMLSGVVMDDLREHLQSLRLLLNSDQLYDLYFAGSNIDNISRIFTYHLSFLTKAIIVVSSAILAFVCIFYSHRSLLNNYVSKHFILKRAENILQDFKFFSVWMLFNFIFNVIMLYFSVHALLFKTISSYLAQNVIFYILIRRGCCNYSVKA